MHNHYPSWMQIPIGGASPSAIYKRFVYNRTGGATVAQGIYMFDTSLSAAAETVANSRGYKPPAVTTFFEEHLRPDQPQQSGGASAWSNIVAQGTLSGTTPVAYSIYAGIFCVALSVVADNDKVEVLVVGDTTVSVIAGTTVLEHRPGSTFIPTIAQTYATMPTYSTSVAKYIGFLKEARTEAVTPAASSVSVFFNGFGLLR